LQIIFANFSIIEHSSLVIPASISIINERKHFILNCLNKTLPGAEADFALTNIIRLANVWITSIIYCWQN